MAYADFTMRSAAAAFGLTERIAPLFPDAEPVPVPGWLTNFLSHSQRQPRISEKARGELIVMPVLLAALEMVPDPVTVFSGVRMDVDAVLGLDGPCDFLLGRAVPLPELRAPFVAVVQAKECDIELGIGPCAAQMVAARLFNEREERRPISVTYGCVTSGEIWQFLELRGSDLTLGVRRYFLNNLPGILGVFQTILAPPPEPVSGPHP